MIRFAVMLLAVAMLLSACSTAEKNPPEMKVAFDPAFAGYNRLLADYVRGDRVDFSAMNRHRASLDTIVSRLGNLDSADFAVMSSAAREAYWINAANIVTLRMIIDAFPIKTLDTLDSARANAGWPLAGRTITLEQVTDSVLPLFNDPRAYLALGCGSISCPPLPERALLADSLNPQLDEICRQYVNNPKWTEFDYAEHTVTVSDLFSRHALEFEARYSPGEDLGGLTEPQASILNFLLAYLDAPLRDRIDLSEPWTVVFRTYNPRLDDIER